LPVFLFLTSRPFNLFFIVSFTKIDSGSGSSGASTALLAQIWKVSWYNVTQVSEAVPHIELRSLFLCSLMLLDFAQLRADDLNKDFIFFKETWLELKHRGNSLWDWINSTLLVSQNVIIIFVYRLHQTYILDIILKRGDWLHNKGNWENMACSEHCIGRNLSIDDSLFASFEEGLKEIVMLYSNNRRHKNVNFMAMNFKSIVSKEFGDSIVSLHNFSLWVLVSWNHHDGSVLSEHHLKVIDLLVVSIDIATLLFSRNRLGPLHHLSLCDKVLSFSGVIFDLHEVIAVDLESLGVVIVDSSKLRPDFVDSLRVVDDIQPQLVKNVQVYHLRVEVRPKLNVVIGTLLNFFLKFCIETFKSDDNSDIKFGEVSATIQGLGFFRGKTTFTILSDEVLLNKTFGSIHCELLLEVCVTFLSHI
jgi:hypothetical protein